MEMAAVVTAVPVALVVVEAAAVAVDSAAVEEVAVVKADTVEVVVMVAAVKEAEDMEEDVTVDTAVVMVEPVTPGEAVIPKETGEIRLDIHL